MSDEKAGNIIPMPRLADQRAFVPVRSLPHQAHEPVDTAPELSAIDLLQALRRRVMLIAASVVIALLVMGLFCVTRARLYTATAIVEIKGYAPVLSGASVESLYGADTRKLEYQKTTIAKLKQPSIADRVLTFSEHAQSIADYFQVARALPMGGAPDAEQDRSAQLYQSNKLINAYLGSIDVNPLSETSLVEIEVTTREPSISAMIANAHAKGFIEELRLERQESMRANLRALERQAAELRTKLGVAEEDLAVYSEKNALIVGSTEGSKDLTLQKIVSLSNLLSQATGRRVEAENLYRQLSQSPLESASSLDGQSMQQSRLELSKLQAEHAALSQKVTAEYPGLVDLKSRIDAVLASIKSARTEGLEALRIKVESERAAEKVIAAQIAEEEGRVHESLRRMARYNVMRKEADSIRELYEAVLKQLQETTISAQSGVSNITVSNWANDPVSPSYPRTSLFMIMALVLGLGLGVALSLLLEFIDNRIRSSDEATAVLGIPLLGMMPAFEQGHVHGRAEKFRKVISRLPFGQLSGSAANQPESRDMPAPPPMVIQSGEARRSRSAIILSEALKTIRAGLLLSSVDTPVQVVMVTSAEKGDGKTTLACNLAVSLAEAEYRTLLIDADLRQGSVQRFFPEVAQGAGLSGVISGQVAIDAAIAQSTVPNLTVMGPGPKPPNPAELIGSRRMRDFIDSARQHYDYVIIDSPPILPVADGLMLSRAVDGVVIVTRAEKTLRRHALEALRRMRRVQANLVGLVVNGVQANREALYGEIYGSSYHEESSPLPPPSTPPRSEAKRSGNVAVGA